MVVDGKSCGNFLVQPITVSQTNMSKKVISFAHEFRVRIETECFVKLIKVARNAKNAYHTMLSNIRYSPPGKYMLY